MEETELGGIFIIGAPASENTLRFKAAYKHQSGTHLIQGEAGVFAVLKLANTGVMGLFVTLQEYDGTSLMIIIWAEEDIALGQMTLSAAYSFIHNVKINNCHKQFHFFHDEKMKP